MVTTSWEEQPKEESRKMKGKRRGNAVLVSRAVPGKHTGTDGATKSVATEARKNRKRVP